MEKFELIGLKSPGTVSLPVHGTIHLEKIDDSLAEKLWKEGLPFLKPKPEHLEAAFFPDKILSPAPLPLNSSRKKKKA